MTKDEIVGALPKLSRIDLMAVYALSGHLLGAMGAVEQGAGPTGQPVYDALVTALGLPTPYAAIAATKTAQLFKKRLPVLIAFLNLHFQGWDQQKVTQLAFLRMLFGLLITDLLERNITPSLGMVISNIGRIPEVFENSFPGYISAGMGQLILKNFQS